MHVGPRSIRSKLMVVFVAAAVVPMGLLGIIFYNSSLRAVADMVGNRTARMAHQVQADLARKLESRTNDQLIVANEPVQAFLKDVRGAALSRRSAALSVLNQYLASLFDQYGEFYDEIILADVKGNPLVRFDRWDEMFVAGESPAPAAPGSRADSPQVPDSRTDTPRAPRPSYEAGVLSAAAPGFRETDRLLFQACLTLAAGSHHLQVDPSDGGQPPTVSILRPVQSNDHPKMRLGYVLLRLRSEYLWPEEWASRRFGQQGHLAIVNARTGAILYHTRSGRIGRSLAQVDPALSLLATGPAKADEGRGPWEWVSGPEGRRVTTILDVAGAPWRVVTTAVPAEFASEARQAALFSLIVAMLALVTAATVLVIASGRLSRSIKTLTAGARRIAGGDLSGPPVLAETHDEIEVLAGAFNAMTVSLRRSIQMREQAAAELDALNRSLEERVHERTRELETLNEALNRANEDLKELDRLKSNFLATVSHEFKTPLTSIKAFAEILHDELEERGVSEELKRFLRIIDAESDRLARLIKNVLDLSRIEAGQMFWRMADFPLARVVEATVDGLLPALKDKKIQVEHDLAYDGAVLHGDQDRIQEVIANVLDNAIKASSTGQSIVIGCHGAAEPGNGGGRMLHLFVRDHGHGIPPDQLDLIFDRFHQVGVHGKRRKGGTGLGLAISREITEYHGGRIWAESKPGCGSTIHITLPIATASSPPRPSQGEAARSGGKTREGPLDA